LAAVVIEPIGFFRRHWFTLDADYIIEVECAPCPNTQKGVKTGLWIAAEGVLRPRRDDFESQKSGTWESCIWKPPVKKPETALIARDWAEFTEAWERERQHE
jgi:hypothetical protein